MAVPLVLKDCRVCLCGTSLRPSRAADSKHFCLILLFSLCAWFMRVCNISAVVWTWSHSFVCSPASPSEGSVDGSVITIPNEDNMEQAYTELLFIRIRLLSLYKYYLNCGGHKIRSRTPHLQAFFLSCASAVRSFLLISNFKFRF